MAVITVKEDITLISLHDSPASMDGVATVFRKIAEAGIDVNMISQSPPYGSRSDLSFTVNGEDFGGVLRIAAELRTTNPDLKISVSSGNCKISIQDDLMKGTPGYAAAVFSAISEVHSDIRMITTSECDISLLVVKADLDSAVQILKEKF